MTENIVHLVLARLPDAPQGTRGISLFLVPKFLVNADGTLGPRNDVCAPRIEHKLGIHALARPASWSMAIEGGAVGFLVGEENKGLACMFTMMNMRGLDSASQGVAIADRAFHQALGYRARTTAGSRRRATGEGMVRSCSIPMSRACS